MLGVPGYAEANSPPCSYTPRAKASFPERSISIDEFLLVGAIFRRFYSSKVEIAFSDTLNGMMENFNYFLAPGRRLTVVYYDHNLNKTIERNRTV